MPPALSTKQPRRPRNRAAAEGSFYYPGEAVRLAGIKGLNYRQLRRLFDIVKGKRATSQAWARFTFRDVVALKVAYTLAKGKKTNHRRPRLHLQEVEVACETLRRRYAIRDPLTQVKLAWDRGRIVAKFEGVHFEPSSGQLLLVAEKVAASATRAGWLQAREKAELRKAARRIPPSGAGACTSCTTPKPALKLAVGDTR